jgi:hypothetical protein
MGGGPVFSCVADAPARLQLQVHYWAIALGALGQVPPDRLLVHAAAPLHPALTAWLEGAGVAVVPIPRYEGGPPYCNKLNQLESVAATGAEHVVLTDCDIVVTGADPWPTPAVLAAKVVDTAHPPASRLTAIFEQAGLGEPDWVPTDRAGSEGARTDVGNRNGGVLVVRRKELGPLGAEWRRWNRWCLDQEAAIGRLHFVDQVSLALARRALGVAFEDLDRAYNFPALPAAEAPPDPGGDGPVVLHHHGRLDADALVARTGLVGVDRAVDRVNRALAGGRDPALVQALLAAAAREARPPGALRRARAAVRRRRPPPARPTSRPS